MQGQGEEMGCEEKRNLAADKLISGKIVTFLLYSALFFRWRMAKTASFLPSRLTVFANERQLDQLAGNVSLEE